jgi:ArsR family transcriptional regulator
MEAVHVDARERRLYALQAELCQVLAGPARQELLHLLGAGERTVSELVQATGLRQANVSQHLATMRQRNVVATRRAGTTIHYSLADPEILEACAIVRGILLRQLAEKQELVPRR